MTKSTAPKIISIISATGWQAIFAVKQPDGTWQAEASPLVAWALVEDEAGEQTLEGVDACDFCDVVESQSGFLGYLAPCGNIAEWAKEAQRYGERRAARRANMAGNK